MSFSRTVMYTQSVPICRNNPALIKWHFELFVTSSICTYSFALSIIFTRSHSLLSEMCATRYIIYIHTRTCDCIRDFYVKTPSFRVPKVLHLFVYIHHVHAFIAQLCKMKLLGHVIISFSIFTCRCTH